MAKYRKRFKIELEVDGYDLCSVGHWFSALIKTEIPVEDHFVDKTSIRCKVEEAK